MGHLDGFLNISKPLGWTSHDVVQFVRRRVGLRRVGHAGTLDPAAGGVLPVCLGRATRLAERVAAGSKVYAADVVLGLATDSADAEGRVVQLVDAPAPALPDVVRALARLLGSVSQLPPAFSALKVEGEPAYARARRGETVRLAPRAVTIYGLAVLDWRPPRLSLVLRCSKGTYVRALARDLGAALGSGAYLDALLRLAVGPFTLADAVTLEQLELAVADDTWRELLLSPDAVLLGLPAAVVGADKLAHFWHGRAWVSGTTGVRDETRAYSAQGDFLGLLSAPDANERWHPALSFAYDADVRAGD